MNTARGVLGENASGLLGGTLLNLVMLAVADQARLAPDARAPISVLVDEFHTIPGADYETILTELNKYGANLVLATQSLERLAALGGDDDHHGLRATVFANLDGLFAFNCSAEDARYLAPELGGALDEQDLLELGEHQCYVRLTTRGERLPTFSVALDPPLASSDEVRTRLAEVSAERYGRAAAEVDADLRAAEARLAASVPTTPAAPQVAARHGGADDHAAKHARNQNRPRRKRRPRPAAEEVVDALVDA